MSAFGTWEVLSREDFERCLPLCGTAAFPPAWQRAVVRRKDFDHSGYVLGNYVDAQAELNQLRLFDEESDVARQLARAFTAAYVFDNPVPLPELPPERLAEYCRDEYGAEGDSLVEPLRAAHAFFTQGLREVNDENLVVFVIR